MVSWLKEARGWFGVVEARHKAGSSKPDEDVSFDHVFSSF
jgi:hypothetical protein